LWVIGLESDPNDIEVVTSRGQEGTFNVDH
jgi:hypothetical protein